MWDYYQDKLLMSISAQHDNDFMKISNFFIKKTQNINYSKNECENRLIKLQLMLKEKEKNAEEFESPLEKTFKRLKSKRKSNDFLKISQEEIKSAYTIDTEGHSVKVSGKLKRL